ncbi:MAG: FHA domain-containing protein [Anaerolineales bacterium]|nr:FHA domain-containing protein [Anaerolineales bacterium]
MNLFSPASRHRSWWIVALATLVITGLLAGIAHAQSLGQIIISETDSSQFPQIALRFRALDGENSVVQDLTLEQLNVRENESPVEVVSLDSVQDGPIRVVYLLDLGRYANFQTLGLPIARSAMSQLVNGDHFIDGTDTVEIRARVSEGQTDRTITLRAPTQTGSEFTASVRSLDFSGTGGPTAILDGVEAILSEMQEGDTSKPTFIVVMTHVVDQPPGSEAVQRAREVAQQAGNMGVRVYTFHTRFDGSQAEPLRVLSGTSGGGYVLLERNVDKSAEIERVYSEIDSQRLAYELTFRSTLSTSDSRTVTLREAGNETQVLGATTYQVAVQAPVVELLEPSPGSTVELSAEAEATPSAPIQVRGRLASWPDGFPRRIQSASLLVDGSPVTTEEIPEEQETFTFSWEPPAEAESGQSFRLGLRVEDELGLQSESETADVAIAAAEEAGLLQSCREDFMQPLCIGLAAIPLVIIVIAVMLLLGIGVAFMGGDDDEKKSRSEASGKPAQPAHTLVPGADDFEAQGQPSGEAGGILGHLEVLSGPPEKVGSWIPIEEYVTVLGRDPERVDVSFYPESKTSVSGVHATLQLYFGKFYLTDNGSTNGTRVNGQQLVAEEPRELSDGDEIILGDASLKGVQLRLHSSEQVDERAGLDATQIEADLDDVAPADVDKTEVWDDEMDEGEESQRGDSWMEDLE